MRYPEKEMNGLPSPDKPIVDPREKELTVAYHEEMQEAAAQGKLSTLAAKYAKDRMAIERQAVLDSLLPDFFNHSYFLHLLEQEVIAVNASRVANTALLMLDLDNFGTFNDRFGHPEGDKLLLKIAHAILGVMRRGDTPGRTGGDEISLLIRRVNESGAVAAARRVQNAVIQASQEWSLAGWNQSISAGICLIQPGLSVERLREISDGALYDSKHAGKNRISMATYNPEDHSIRSILVAPKEQMSGK